MGELVAFEPLEVVVPVWRVGAVLVAFVLVVLGLRDVLSFDPLHSELVVVGLPRGSEFFVWWSSWPSLLGLVDVSFVGLVVPRSERLRSIGCMNMLKIRAPRGSMNASRDLCWVPRF